MIILKLSAGFEDTRERLFVSSAYNKTIITILKSIPGARWNSFKKQWSFPLKKEIVLQLIDRTNGIAVVEKQLLDTALQNRIKTHLDERLRDIEPATAEAIRRFIIWMEQQRYSDQTIKNYLSHLIQFFRFYTGRSYHEIKETDIHHYNYEGIVKKGFSRAFQKGITGALKLFFSHSSGESINIEKLKYPQKEKRLPEILSKIEIQEILQAADNLKHRTMLSVLYACGMRRSELLNLKIRDIDGQRNLIRIFQGKGNKDRYVPLTEKLKMLLREYYVAFQPKDYLFEGQYGGRYSGRSLEMVLTRCVSRTRIKKRVTLHTLRHSYATHQLEGGIDIRYIQELLGHKSPNTTMIYTHVSSKKISELQSPFDDLTIIKDKHENKRKK